MPNTRATLAAVLVAVCGCEAAKSPDPPPAPAAEAEASAEQVHRFCAGCHAYPPPESFPRDVWRKEVVQGYRFFGAAPPDVKARLGPVPDQEDVVRYFERRAPDRLGVLDPPARPCPVRFDAAAVGGPPGAKPGVAYLTLAPLRDARRPDLIACDMITGFVAAADPAAKPPKWDVLAKLDNPCHAEVVDLDKDRVRDVIVADLGQLFPSDAASGRVVWLRGTPGGAFTPVPLLTGVGRVADVQAADFDGDGDLDLVVAAFGWRERGNLLWLENKTTDWAKPAFVPHEIDARHGAIHVPVADLNGDGRPDFVALFSQEHEAVVAFVNEGGGRFRPETLYAAPDPAYGSSGLQLVDLDGDGDLDVLYANGDTMDSDLLKPYHGVQWLENQGGLRFAHHKFAAMYGVHRAVAADFDGDGDLDIVAVGCTAPAMALPPGRPVTTVMLLEQTAKGRFEAHALEADRPYHLACAAGDWTGDGRADFAVGEFDPTGKRKDAAAWVTLWQNLGKK